MAWTPLVPWGGAGQGPFLDGASAVTPLGLSFLFREAEANLCLRNGSGTTERTQIARTRRKRRLSFPSLFIQRPIQHVHKCHFTNQLLEKSLRRGGGGKGERQAGGLHVVGKSSRDSGRSWSGWGLGQSWENYPGLQRVFSSSHLDPQAPLLLSRPLSPLFRSLEGHRALQEEGLQGSVPTFLLYFPPRFCTF